MSYQPHPTKTEGGLRETRVSDDNAQELLAAIWQELKKMNLQLLILTGEQVADDVDEEILK